LSDSQKLELQGISFLLIVFFSPYFITFETLLGGSRLRLLAPLWGVFMPTGSYPRFEIPLSLSYDYFVFWGMGFLYILVVLLSLSRQEKLTFRGYLYRIGAVLLLQVVAYVFTLLRLSGGFPITIIPLPIPAIAALLLTPRVIKIRDGLWDTTATVTK
jgi:hypothetical protein